MSIKTRIDGRSSSNCKIYIKNSRGEVVAEVCNLGARADLDIVTHTGHYIQKPNGWTSEDKGRS